jgi:hypothetical protein
VITRKKGLSFPPTYLDIFLPSSYFFYFFYSSRVTYMLYLMYNPTYPETLYFALNGKRGERKKKKNFWRQPAALLCTLHYIIKGVAAIYNGS